MLPETVFEVEWFGPNSLASLEKYAEDNGEEASCWSLYCIYGDHPLYGKNVPVYIGKATGRVPARLKKHSSWLEGDVYVGTAYKFENWQISEGTTFEDKDRVILEDATIQLIEKLMIFSLQPAYNRSNKSTANGASSIRIFNTGRLGDLPTEISGGYAIENVPELDDVD